LFQKIYVLYNIRIGSGMDELDGPGVRVLIPVVARFF
jgi:hypothetical protein